VGPGARAGRPGRRRPPWPLPAPSRRGRRSRGAGRGAGGGRGPSAGPGRAGRFWTGTRAPRPLSGALGPAPGHPRTTEVVRAGGRERGPGSLRPGDHGGALSWHRTGALPRAGEEVGLRKGSRSLGCARRLGSATLSFPGPAQVSWRLSFTFLGDWAGRGP
jgi:hypothetical protein